MSSTVNAKDKFVYVPYGMAVHGDEEIAAVVNVLNTSTQMGKYVYKFENSVASLFNKRHGIMVNSGSSALLLANQILNLPKNSEVITPALTFATTVSSIVLNGLIPSFVDVKKATYCIDLDKVVANINKNTRAICVPNLLGNIADWEKISQISKEHNLVIIEDSADTLGGKLNGKSSGYYSDISITSFYGSHIINCAGNGGMLCVNNEKYASDAKLLRSWGRSSSLFTDSENVKNRFNVQVDGINYDAKFLFDEIGYNLEPSEMGAAYGLVQLNNLQSNIDSRISNYETQFKFFQKYEKWFELPIQTENTTTGWLAFPLTVKKSAPFTRTELQIFFENRNIQTRVIFTGNITRQNGFRNIKMVHAKDGYPESDNVMEGGLLLACHHGLTEEMLEHVHTSFEIFSEKFNWR